jgi:hypothetical protein
VVVAASMDVKVFSVACGVPCTAASHCLSSLTKLLSTTDNACSKGDMCSTDVEDAAKDVWNGQISCEIEAITKTKAKARTQADSKLW